MERERIREPKNAVEVVSQDGRMGGEGSKDVERRISKSVGRGWGGGAVIEGLWERRKINCEGKLGSDVEGL